MELAAADHLPIGGDAPDSGMLDTGLDGQTQPLSSLPKAGKEMSTTSARRPLPKSPSQIPLTEFS